MVAVYVFAVEILQVTMVFSLMQIVVLHNQLFDLEDNQREVHNL